MSYNSSLKSLKHEILWEFDIFATLLPGKANVYSLMFYHNEDRVGYVPMIGNNVNKNHLHSEATHLDPLILQNTISLNHYHFVCAISINGRRIASPFINSIERRPETDLRSVSKPVEFMWSAVLTTHLTSSSFLSRIWNEKFPLKSSRNSLWDYNWQWILW